MFLSTFARPKCYTLCVLIALLIVSACGSQRTESSSRNTETISDDSLLTLIQYRSFQYFYEGAEPVSGAAPERIHLDGDYPDNDKHIVTSGGTGFGVMAILVGIERKFITRQQGYEQLSKIVSFLEKADRFHGAWPHWMNGQTGKVKPFSKNDDGGDLVETAFLVQGLLCARQYFKDGSEEEKQLAARMDKLWREVEWNWYQRDGQNVLYWHWSPNNGWAMNFALEGYNECLITYVLAAASPTYPIPAEAYHQGWARGGGMRNDSSHNQYGLHLALKHNGAPQYGGPLFWSHYSFLGLDPRNLKDAYADYWQHNVNHVRIGYQYCVENPKGFKGYGENAWGLTAGYSIRFYAAHSPGEDMGVITPTGALSSFPYLPEEAMRAARYFYNLKEPAIWGKYGFYDGYSEQEKWTKPWYLAIDQGPIPVMIENYRTGLLWNLFMSCPEVQAGLDKLGFTY